MVYTILSALGQQEIIIRVSRTEVAFFNSQKEVKKKNGCVPLSSSLLTLFPQSPLSSPSLKGGRREEEEGGKGREGKVRGGRRSPSSFSLLCPSSPLLSSPLLSSPLLSSPLLSSPLLSSPLLSSPLLSSPLLSLTDFFLPSC